MANILSAVVTPEQYRTNGREHIFPSPQALDWNQRVMRKELHEAGAVILIAGKRMIHAEKYDQVLLEYSARRAAEKAAKSEAAAEAA